MKGIVKLRTRGSGVCKVGEAIFFWVEAEDVTYYIPVTAEAAMDPYLQELKAYLVLKWGKDVAEAFLEYGWPYDDASKYFDTVGGGLDRPLVIADVDHWLES